MPPRPRSRPQRPASRPAPSRKASKAGQRPTQQQVPDSRGQIRRRPSPVDADAENTNASAESNHGPHRGQSADRKEPDSLTSGIRLQKFMATAGVDSRRNCEDYIRTGRVTVNGDVVIDPAINVDPETQDIRLDGERLRMPKFKYYLLNKPKGVLCTNSDPEGRPRAIDLIPSQGRRLFTVGRLDESTEGLLLITNDGDLAERLAHPRFEVVRRYRCQVAGIPKDDTLQQMREGMYFSDGFFRFRGVRVLKRKGRSVMLELELREGKNREIRRLLAKVGHKVISLERIAFGPLRLGYLRPGKHRELHPGEVLELRRALAEMELSGRNADSNRRPLKKRPASADETTETVQSKGTTSGREPRKTAAQPSVVRKRHGVESASVKSGTRKTAAKKAAARKPAKLAPINKGRDRRRQR
jgi:23S rRNA pseudouridine2605 synthase